MIGLCKAFGKLPAEIRAHDAHELLQLLAIAAAGAPDTEG